MTDGFKDFGAAEEYVFMPFLMGFVLMVAIFEPFLFLDVIKERLFRLSHLSASIRGVICGVSVFIAWAALYVLGLKYPGFEMPLIFLGYALAFGIVFLSAWTKTKSEPVATPDEGPKGPNRVS